MSMSTSIEARALDVIAAPPSALNRIRFSADYAEENAKPKNQTQVHAIREIGLLSSA